MISKEEAEEKLLKIFYDVKLDSYFDLYPTSANIEEFEEKKDPSLLDQRYDIDIKENELVIAMRANSYEHGIPFFAVNMAYNSAIHWHEDPLFKHMKRYLLFHYILLIFINLGLYITDFSLFGAILINIIGIGIFIYFIVLRINWKKRILIRFRELFKITGVYLPEEKIKQYSKLPPLDILNLNILQCSIIFFIILIWVIIISTKWF